MTYKSRPNLPRDGDNMPMLSRQKQLLSVTFGVSSTNSKFYLVLSEAPTQP